MSNLDLNANVGNVLVCLDVHAGCSPFLRAVLPAGTDPVAIAAALEVGINAAVRGVLGQVYECTLGDGVRVSVHGGSGVIRTEEERRHEFGMAMMDLADAQHDAAEARAEELANHPDNGRRGYWLVAGMRHTALVRGVSTADEAVAKAADIVGSWESPDVRSVGEELPEVMEV